MPNDDMARQAQARALQSEWATDPRWRGIQRDYTATKHQREGGTSYFDQILLTVTGGAASTAVLAGSTEAERFQPAALAPVDADR